MHYPRTAAADIDSHARRYKGMHDEHEATISQCGFCSTYAAPDGIALKAGGEEEAWRPGGEERTEWWVRCMHVAYVL
uniref:Uncharacterized protein n=1 Tax=Knipowitschia caucasica TaxID=637954 RepID=A0AAV2KEI8_KNICA